MADKYAIIWESGEYYGGVCQREIVGVIGSKEKAQRVINTLGNSDFGIRLFPKGKFSFEEITDFDALYTPIEDTLLKWKQKMANAHRG